MPCTSQISASGMQPHAATPTYDTGVRAGSGNYYFNEPSFDPFRTTELCIDATAVFTPAEACEARIPPQRLPQHPAAGEATPSRG